MTMRYFPDRIGESLRGLQSQLNMLGAMYSDEEILGDDFAEILGAPPPQRRPVSALQRLGQAAALQRLGRHAPMTHTVPSQYKDSNGFGISVDGTLLAAQFSNTNYPTINGSTRAFVSIKPQKIIIDEDLIFTWTNSSGTTTTVASVDNAGDVLLISAYVGNKNVFATAPTQATGFSGRALSNVALGNGVSWPTVNPGIDVVVTLAVKPTAQYRSAPPTGYTQSQLVSVRLIAQVNVFGEQLR